MPKLERLPRIASIAAFAIAAIIVLAGLAGPIILIPFAIIPLCAGVGILRRRVWSAYGFAMFSFTQLLLIPIVLLRPGSLSGGPLKIIANVFGSLALGFLFLAAGRSLAASGAIRGKALLWVVATALTTLPFFFVQTFSIPTGSMENTLLPGDRILALMFPRPTLEQGEMVLFVSPENRGAILVKRVIAVPGDHLRISRKVVILNGAALEEKYAVHNAGGPDFYPDEFPNEVALEGCAEGHEMLSQHVVNGEIVVPAGQVFVLGDNRENSLDSRCWGFVNSGDVVGRPLLIYDSINQTVEQASLPSENLMGHRRWGRLFKVF
jgi:signal peptidase I